MTRGWIKLWIVLIELGNAAVLAFTSVMALQAMFMVLAIGLTGIVASLIAALWLCSRDKTNAAVLLAFLTLPGMWLLALVLVVPLQLFRSF